MLIAALQDVADVLHKETAAADKIAVETTKLPPGILSAAVASGRLQFIVKPVSDPDRHKSIKDMMERAVKAGFCAKAADEKIFHTPRRRWPLRKTGSLLPSMTFPRQTLVSLLVFAASWQALSYLAPFLGIPPFAVPSLLKIARSIAAITPIDIVVTLARVIGALIVSFVLGLVLAMAMYRSEPLDNYLHPMIRILMAVPVVSWILFAVLWFPGVEFRIGFVLVVVCGPVFLVNSLDAMRGVPRELRHMMLSFRPTTLLFFVKLMLPAIVPTIFTSWKVNISLAIRVVTIAELVGAVTGIGHQFSVAQELFSVSDVFAWTIVLVALLFLLEGAGRARRSAAAAVAAMRMNEARNGGPPPIEVRGLRKVFRQTTTANRWSPSTGSI